MSQRVTVVANQITPLKRIPHHINGKNVDPLGSNSIPVFNPATGNVIASVVVATPAEIEEAVAAASNAFVTWSAVPVKQRAQILLVFRELMMKNRDWFVENITLENGKHRNDALASFMKGLETVDYACSLPALLSGSIQEVSNGVTCQDRRDPVGVVVSVFPFNFPVMVPLWTIPVALACGNTIILKPSEKVPSCVLMMAALLTQAGVPPGAVSVLQGDGSTVTALCTHPKVNAVTFVGSSTVAEIVDSTSIKSGKRALCRGGAKNHLIALPDADLEMTSSDVLQSFAGSAGQRCMAASVLILVGQNKK